MDNQKDVELLVEANQNSLDNLIIEVEEYKKLVASSLSNSCVISRG